jgi:hypothetical protein
MPGITCPRLSSAFAAPARDADIDDGWKELGWKPHLHDKARSIARQAVKESVARFPPPSVTAYDASRFPDKSCIDVPETETHLLLWEWHSLHFLYIVL